MSKQRGCTFAGCEQQPAGELVVGDRRYAMCPYHLRAKHPSGSVVWDAPPVPHGPWLTEVQGGLNPDEVWTDPEYGEMHIRLAVSSWLWMGRLAPNEWIDLAAWYYGRPHHGEVHLIYSEPFGAWQFDDGLLVDVYACPRMVLDRRHYSGDGECACPAEEK